ncbi:hypothetical protein AMAG_05209 [Allomyces macrogynus ATCC 38327]|uniref:Mitochondrial ribosomal protein subunit L20-domain-containing protein n=1 Tax=Allomyces macrogynus (strain ATCC 38327) TaxID=578462 RepID=A0A0L0SBF9_ALLM3|nr:hypothetical protein AMAG_05209 [Allomyces macrogynus ATCC 38327]|eukprot:KNE59744.1 hypothetical protein AMAG_05209 [Allomyces macrogynus ATCC 38327]
MPHLAKNALTRAANLSARRLLPSQPLPPTPIKLKPKSMPKLKPAVATLPDGTTVHLNSAAFAPVFDRATLPPPSHTWAPTSLARDRADPIEPRAATRLTEEQITEMRALRTQDPETWTVRKLAAKYNVAGVFVSMAVRCPEERLSQLAEREAYRVSRLPATTMHHIRDRQRRRALW